MKEYVKPIVLANEELAEGVYAASGQSCYTVTADVKQGPQEGRGDFRVQVDAVHAATDGHHSGAQVLSLTFNQPVVYVSSEGELVGGDGTSTIQISYHYHNNGSDNIGLGNVFVTADQGLAVTDASLSCNYDCGQH